MPRYFFHVVEGQTNTLVKDSGGAVFPNASEAKKEAAGLARDIARHRLPGLTETWRVIVTDENGDEVLTVPLSRSRKVALPRFDLADRIARVESHVRLRPLVWLATAVVLVMIVQAAITSVVVTDRTGSYQTASAPAEGSFLAVRFVRHANAGDIARFLDVYKISPAGSLQPGRLHRLRVANTALPREELAKIAHRMMSEHIVEFVAAVQ